MAPSARDRILDAADRLFYERGIGAVGVDLVVAESGAAKQTLYNHFDSKDALVAAYLERRSHRALEDGRRRVDETDGADARERVGVLFADVGRTGDGAYRGCPFINATAEYPDPTHPVRVVVADHRERFADLVATALGDRRDEDLVRAVVELHDGTMVAAVHDAPGACRAAALALDRLLGS